MNRHIQKILKSVLKTVMKQTVRLKGFRTYIGRTKDFRTTIERTKSAKVKMVTTLVQLKLLKQRLIE